MVNTCDGAYCKTGYKNSQHKINVIPEKFPVFCFPLKNPELNRKWIRFVNRRHWAPTQRSGIYSQHFEEKFLKVGKQKRYDGNYNQFHLYNLTMNPNPRQLCLHPKPKESLQVE